MMNRTNRRTSYTLSGEKDGFQASLEVTKYDGSQRIEASGSLSKEMSSHYVRYNVSETGSVDISINGPEATSEAAAAALRAIVNAERQEDTEEA